MTPALPRTSRVGLTLNRLLLGIALLILLFSFAVYVVYAANLIRFPFDYDQGEGFELVDTIMFSQGQFPVSGHQRLPVLFEQLSAAVPCDRRAVRVGVRRRLTGTGGCSAFWGRWSRRRRLPTPSTATAAARRTRFALDRAAVRAGVSGVEHGLSHWAAVSPAHDDGDVRDAGGRRAGARQRNRGHGQTPPDDLRRAGAGAGSRLHQAVSAGDGGRGVRLPVHSPAAPRRDLGDRLCAGRRQRFSSGSTSPHMASGGFRRSPPTSTSYIPDQTTGLFRLWFSLHGFLLVPAVLYAIYELYFSRLSIYTIWFAAAVGVAS